MQHVEFANGGMRAAGHKFLAMLIYKLTGNHTSYVLLKTLLSVNAIFVSVDIT
jgi:hypothetical protein